MCRDYLLAEMPGGTPDGWEDTPAAAADRQAVKSLAAKLWSDVARSEAHPVTTTPADAWN